jgi:hypothetical protein
VHRGARALQRAVDGRHARLEHVGRLLRRAAEHVAQDQHRALERDQPLDRDEVSQLDRLLGDDGGLGVVLLAGQRVEQPVRVRLEPQRLARRGHAARALVERVEARVGGDLVQPGAQRGARGERLAPAPRAQERLLDGILGLLEGTEHPVAVDVQLAAVTLDAVGERRAVEKCGGHARVTGGPAKSNRGSAVTRAATRRVAARSPGGRAGSLERARPRRRAAHVSLTDLGLRSGADVLM